MGHNVPLLVGYVGPVKEGESLARPSWTEYFMDITHMVAKRATCLRRNVGAILVKDKRILDIRLGILNVKKLKNMLIQGV